MPHQCLSCGYAFEEGSSELLAGCPQCKGTRFFYSAKPVEDAERKALQDKAQKDLRQVVTELLADAAPEAAAELQSKADADGWATIKPRDLRKLVKQVQAAAPARDVAEEAVDSPKRLAAVEKARQEILAEMDAKEERPETVEIRDAGEYAIDVKALLERNPIVVHKDGAYLIHLPSLFQGKD